MKSLRMKSLRLPVIIVAPVTVLCLTVAVALPASAATTERKLEVMAQWSQPTSASFDSWSAAHDDRHVWASYVFDWSTDGCSLSPDQPLGFDFRMACQRHDFGYRNAKTMKTFPADKARIDDSFYFDLTTICGSYAAKVRPSCGLLAWTYFIAVDRLGTLSIDQSQLDAAAELKAQAETNVG